MAHRHHHGTKKGHVKVHHSGGHKFKLGKTGRVKKTTVIDGGMSHYKKAHHTKAGEIRHNEPSGYSRNHN